MELRLKASAGSKGCNPGRNEQPAADSAHPVILSLFRIAPRTGFHKEPLQSFDACRRHYRKRLVLPGATGGCIRPGSCRTCCGQMPSDVISHLVVPDEQREIEDALRQQCEVANLVVTTGGTGVAPRDVTPEATRAVCDRLLDGFAELMRAEGRKQTQVCPSEPLAFGHPGPISDCESAGQPTRRQELARSSSASHSARFNSARGNSYPT